MTEKKSSAAHFHHARVMHKDLKYTLLHGTMMSWQQMLYLFMGLNTIKQKTIVLPTLPSQVAAMEGGSGPQAMSHCIILYPQRM